MVCFSPRGGCYLFDGVLLLQLFHGLFFDGQNDVIGGLEPDGHIPLVRATILTASMAYSTWSSSPFGENVVMAVS